MLLTDTDGLMFKTDDENVYEDFCKDEDKDFFDFSNYLKDSKYYNNWNNFSVAGEKCDVKCKMYNFITEHNYESKKAKSTNKNVVDNEPKYEDYKNVLFKRSYMRHDMNRILSRVIINGSSSNGDKKYTLRPCQIDFLFGVTRAHAKN